MEDVDDEPLYLDRACGLDVAKGNALQRPDLLVTRVGLWPADRPGQRLGRRQRAPRRRLRRLSRRAFGRVSA
jgi:hypothetical protein